MRRNFNRCQSFLRGVFFVFIFSHANRLLVSYFTKHQYGRNPDRNIYFILNKRLNYKCVRFNFWYYFNKMNLIKPTAFRENLYLNIPKCMNIGLDFIFLEYFVKVLHIEYFSLFPLITFKTVLMVMPSNSENANNFRYLITILAHELILIKNRSE